MPKSKQRKRNVGMQVVRTEKRKILVDKYLSPKGKRLVEEGKLTKKQAEVKYGKNRYYINPNSKQLKEIKH